MKGTRYGLGQLSILAWALSILGIDCPESFDLLAEKAIDNIRGFTVQELHLLSWGFSFCSGIRKVQLFCCIERELTPRFFQFDPVAKWLKFASLDQPQC